LTFLASCSEAFKTIDAKKFNEKIATRTDIKTPQELIKLYYDYSESAGNPKLTIEAKDLGNNSFEIILIQEGFEDDSQSSQKIVMTAKQTGLTWIVKEIKENWKCWDGRGQTSWGIRPCN